MALYFRFRFWPTRSHQHVILHLLAKFCRNRTIGGGVMTSYRFFKTAAMESEIYYRVQASRRHLFKKLEIYLLTKFRWDTSINGWDKNTSGFGKRTAAILEYYFRFRFWPNFRHRRVILHQPAEFRQNRTTLGGVMTSCPFFKMAAGGHIGFHLGNVRPPMKCQCSEIGPQIWSSQQPRKRRPSNVFRRFGHRSSPSLIDPEISPTSRLIFTCESWRHFWHHSILSHPRLKMQQDVWILKQTGNAAMCPLPFIVSDILRF